MSGRVIVDDVEAGDPLIYASNQRVEAWHRFGVHFADGGSFMLRDPRRLGAVELDPDESRLGPDALTLTYKQLDHALDARTAPVKAVLMDQARVAGLGNLLDRRGAVARRHRPGAPAGRPRSRRRASGLHRAIRDTRARARPARREPHRRHAARSRCGVPAGRHAVAAAHRRRAHDVLVPDAPALNVVRSAAHDRYPSSSRPNACCCGRGATSDRAPFAALNADPGSDALLPGAADARRRATRWSTRSWRTSRRAAGDCGRSRSSDGRAVHRLRRAERPAASRPCSHRASRSGGGSRRNTGARVTRAKRRVRRCSSASTAVEPRRDPLVDRDDEPAVASGDGSASG